MRTRVQVLAAAAIASAVAGCGGSAGSANSAGPAKTADSRPAATIVAQVKNAFTSAKSVHMAGRITDSGATYQIDLSLIRSGGIAGSVAGAGKTLEIIEAGQSVYIKVTSAFLKLANAPASVCQKVCGKYVMADASNGKKIVGDLSMSHLLGQLRKDMPSFTKSGTTTINGQQALVLHGSDGSTMDVAAAGPPYPLRIQSPASTGTAGELDFSQWNAVPAIAAPPASKVINLSQLAG